MELYILSLRLTIGNKISKRLIGSGSNISCSFLMRSAFSSCECLVVLTSPSRSTHPAFMATPSETGSSCKFVSCMGEAPTALISALKANHRWTPLLKQLNARAYMQLAFHVEWSLKLKICVPSFSPLPSRKACLPSCCSPGVDSASREKWFRNVHESMTIDFNILMTQAKYIYTFLKKNFISLFF
jgi:hypothetical protein